MNNYEPVTFSEVLSIIENTGDFEMAEIMAAIRRRYRKFYPDWEVLYLACPKNDPAQRQQTLAFLQEHFQKHT